MDRDMDRDRDGVAAPLSPVQEGTEEYQEITEGEGGGEGRNTRRLQKVGQGRGGGRVVVRGEGREGRRVG